MCKLNFLKNLLTLPLAYGIIIPATSLGLCALQIKFYFYTEERYMSTFMAKKGEVERKWYILDAAGKPLGRTAAQAATLLRGKHKPTYTPHVDCGDYVIIINCDKAVLTGNKLTQKHWYRHTGYVGHLKDTRYDTLMASRPEKAMELAVKGMVPSNTIGRAALLRLKLVVGDEHKHQAQKPEVWDK